MTTTETTVTEKAAAMPGNLRMVRDDSSNNPHLVKLVNGEPRALCNARYRVWDANTIETHSEPIWSWAHCPRCMAKYRKSPESALTAE